jgi:hypothetical protein
LIFEDKPLTINFLEGDVDGDKVILQGIARKGERLKSLALFYCLRHI